MLRFITLEGCEILVQFDVEKFTRELKKYRGNRPQNIIADELNINRSTISLLENGRQIPTLRILQEFCSHANLSPNDFFIKEEEINQNYNNIDYELSKEDNTRLLKVIKRIKIREKYISLSNKEVLIKF